MRIWTALFGITVFADVRRMTQSEILKLSINQLEDLWSRSITPTKVPTEGARIVGTALQIGGSRLVARLLNLFYMGDVMKHVCNNGVAIGNVVVLGKEMIQGLWFTLPNKTNTSYPASGLIADFTQPLWQDCDGPGQQLVRNPWPFNNLFDIWRQVPGDDNLLLGKSFRLVKPYESKSYGFMLLDTTPIDPPLIGLESNLEPSLSDEVFRNLDQDVIDFFSAPFPQ